MIQQLPGQFGCVRTRRTRHREGQGAAHEKGNHEQTRRARASQEKKEEKIQKGPMKYMCQRQKCKNVSDKGNSRRQSKKGCPYNQQINKSQAQGKCVVSCRVFQLKRFKAVKKKTCVGAHLAQAT